MTSTDRSNRLAVLGAVRIPATQDDYCGFRALDSSNIHGVVLLHQIETRGGADNVSHCGKLSNSAQGLPTFLSLTRSEYELINQSIFPALRPKQGGMGWSVILLPLSVLNLALITRSEAAVFVNYLEATAAGAFLPTDL